MIDAKRFSDTLLRMRHQYDGPTKQCLKRLYQLIMSNDNQPDIFSIHSLVLQ